MKDVSIYNGGSYDSLDGSVDLGSSLSRSNDLYTTKSIDARMGFYDHLEKFNCYKKYVEVVRDLFPEEFI